MFTAREILTALHADGWLDASWGNTGGGVYNVTFTPVCQHDTVLGEIRISDNGDWTEGDMDTPAESVSVFAYDMSTGDPVDMEFTVTDPRGAVVAVDALSLQLETVCPQCSADRG